MLELHEPQTYSGYTRHGPPPVVRFVLRITPGLVQDTAHDPTRALLAQLGVPDIPLDHSLRALAGDTAAARFASLTVRLMNTGGHESSYAHIEENSADSEASICIACDDVPTCEEAGQLAARLLASQAAQDKHELRKAIEGFLTLAEARLPDGSARLLLDVAQARGLPTLRLDQPPMETKPADAPLPVGLIQIGHGTRRRVLAGAMPADKDIRRAEHAADRRWLIPRLLKAGLPVGIQDLEYPNKRQPKRAVRAAERIGFPVTVRPVIRGPLAHRNPSVGSYGPLYRPDEVVVAFEGATGALREVWVESHPAGQRYRFVILQGRVRAVARCRPPTLVGDGKSPVASLIQARMAAAQHPRERSAWRRLLTGDADSERRLGLAGVTRATVLESGRRLPLRDHGTPYNGGDCEDATPTVAEPIAGLAVRAASACGLEHFAGVEMAIVDPEGQASAGNCIVVDVVPDPDLLTHDAAAELTAALLDQLFPNGESGRIPIFSITGTNGKTTTIRMIAHILGSSGAGIGLASTYGTSLDGEQRMEGDVAGVPGASMILSDDRAHRAVLETARGGLIKQGILFEHCDVGVCLNVQDDHLGVDGIQTLDDMATVKAEVIRRTANVAVLNAADPRCLAMRGNTEARETILVTASASAAVDEHCRAGGRAVALITDSAGQAIIICRHGKRREQLIAAADIPATHDGMARFNSVNAAFAAAATWGFGMSPAAIAAALTGFSSDYGDNPGRLNVYDHLPFRVIVDYAHNPAAMDALCAMIEALPVRGRRILVIGGPGARPDEAIEALGRQISGHFDGYVCMSTTLPGKREPQEVPALVRRGLLAAGVPDTAVRIIPSRPEAVAAALDSAEPGDIVTIIAGRDLEAVTEQILTRTPYHKDESADQRSGSS